MNTTDTERPIPCPPTHGEHAADLIYDEQADPQRGGIWIYPACYDDFYLARRRAHSLSQSFGVPFRVDLFGARRVDGPCGDLTPSTAIYEPGYYPFTVHDPRPRLIRIPRVPASSPKRQAERQAQTEEAQRP